MRKEEEEIIVAVSSFSNQKSNDGIFRMLGWDFFLSESSI